MNNSQSITDIVHSMNAEQRVLWNDILLRFGERITVVPFYFSSQATAIGTTQYGTFAARRIFFYLSLDIGTRADEMNQGYISIYNESNAICFQGYSVAFFSDLQRYHNKWRLETFYAGRILAWNFSAEAYLKGVGFRITY